MSIATVTALPEPKRPADGFYTRAALEGWRSWLRDALVPDWRPGEWDPELMLFTGDPDNPRTTLFRCLVERCDTVVATRSHCSICGIAFRAGKLDAETFNSTHVPTPNRLVGARRPNCLIGGGTCQRESHNQGMCAAHMSRWHQVRKARPDTVFEDWVATKKPYGPMPACRIVGCAHDASRAENLCLNHRKDWKKHSGQHGLDIGDEAARKAWAATRFPFMTTGQFSLHPLQETVRLELLFAMQQREARGMVFSPRAVRLAVKRLLDLSSIAASGDAYPRLEEVTECAVRSFLRETRRTIDRAYKDYQGISPTDGTVWDLTELDIPSVFSASGVRVREGKIDFTEIQQPWMRQLAMTWVDKVRPDSRALRYAFRGLVVASQALYGLPGGGMDPTKLAFADMDVIVDAFRVMPRWDGTDMGPKGKRLYLSNFFEVIDYGRRNGLLDQVPGPFARHSSHRIPDEVQDEDETGKAIPESVIRQLDQQLHLLGEGIPYGRMAAGDIKAMFQTAYVVLRDTGRRPQEVARLVLDCLEKDGDEHQLIWDNRKSKRLRRRLPVTQETVDVINAWKARRAGLDLPPNSARFLFPAITNNTAHHQMESSSISRAMRAWVRSLERIDSETLGPDGTPLPFDRSLIYPYAFRHSYCQRHADAGVPQDVLRDLMDHRSANTTAGYYKVSLKRKREAVKTMRQHVMDRVGLPAPMASNTSYELRSVAVPFGNCTEPSNVKAGGQACPIRFQCAGCGHYRPDPSYLPAVEDHIRTLKGNREMAMATGAAEFVTRGLGEEIAAFQQVGAKMKEYMSNLPEDERNQVEEAAKVLRKVRAASGERPLLPLTVVSRNRTREGR
ncbi:tyrosine-type recombinase/integrase [Streptomyces sp. TRM64462]|uniref:tyrosine-type recombinase/integrase n=1 Tax=Streptomyces sp. TRM64462 TaxID=2741726 RepID=UPI001586EB6E|nr:tyrosine-type recombinase/integrase [Streptomyces sp. TRM64462]